MTTNSSKTHHTIIKDHLFRKMSKLCCLSTEKKIHVKVCFTVQLKDLRFLFRFFLNTKFSKQLQHNVLFCYLYCFFFFRRASRKAI